MKTKLLLTLTLLIGFTIVKAQTNWTVYNTSNSLISSNSVFGVVIDSINNIWIGTSTTKNLDKFVGSECTNYSNNQIVGVQGGNLVIDLKGNKWVAGDGLVVFTGLKFTNYDGSISGIPNNSIYSIAIDKKNNKWIGTRDQGIVKFNDTIWTKYTTSNSGIPDNHIYSIAINKNGDIWMGTYGSGVVKFDGKTWTTYSAYNTVLPSNTVWDVKFDPNGNLWCGTSNGVAKFDGINWTVYNSYKTGLSGVNVNCFEFSKNGDTWIGTDGYGLVKFDGTNWSVYNTSNSGLPNNKIWSLAFDKNQQKLCIATLGGGLALLNFSNPTAYNEINSTDNISFYPNPATDKITINSSVTNYSDVTLNFYDLTSRLISSKHLLNKFTNIDDLNNGVYLVEIKTKEWSKTQRLIIRR